MNILAIGAHPDDIEFGCGGALLKYARASHGVYLLVLTSGKFGADPQVRTKEQEEVAKFLGVKDLFWGGFKDTELIDNRELILKIEEVVDKIRPDIVFINYPEDVHQDHRAASHAGVSATRYIKEVLFFEVPTTHNFDPDIFVDIGDILDDKMKLLKLHASQVDRTKVENLTILESAKSCATFRGFQGRVKYAEGFRALRILRDIQ
ncbi:MAG: PIG-L family deacetylase [Candidatus Omnitrophica bacterium]|nr:PIG-L family deacetylase [Candidatus Omnitrophota bacterium]